MGAFEQNLKQRATVRRPTQVETELGGTTHQMGAHLASVPCALHVASGTERIIRGSPGVEVTHYLYTSIHDIREGDEVEVDSIAYDVMFVGNVQGHHLKIELASERPSR